MGEFQSLICKDKQTLKELFVGLAVLLPQIYSEHTNCRLDADELEDVSNATIADSEKWGKNWNKIFKNITTVWDTRYLEEGCLYDWIVRFAII